MRKIHPLSYGIIVGGSLLVASSAIAGGFSIREQSTTGLGKAFADSAAGTDLSSMYWNPAAVTTQDGLNSVSSFTAILPQTRITPAAGNGTEIDTVGLLGASYYNYQINQQFYAGLSINSPFGLVTEADNRNWAGAILNRKSEILTINAAPTLGYKMTPNLSFAAGLQIEYMKVRLSGANPFPTPAAFATDIVVKGDDVAVGFTLGALYKSEESGTAIGIGYRSSVSHKIEGSIRGIGTVLPVVNSQFSPDGGVTANLDTPEIITASIRQEVSPAFAVMANVEWTNWSRMKELRIISKTTGTTSTPVTDFSWKDSWFASAGAEYRYTEALTLRTGAGFESTPVPDATRSARLPDSDRVWLSLGASYKWSDATMLDFGYSHIFFADTNLASTLPVAASSKVENGADIISLGARMKW